MAYEYVSLATGTSSRRVRGNRRIFYWTIGSIVGLLTLYLFFRRGGNSIHEQHLKKVYEYRARHHYQPTDYAHDHHHGSGHDHHHDHQHYEHDQHIDDQHHQRSYDHDHHHQHPHDHEHYVDRRGSSHGNDNDHHHHHDAHYYEQHHDHDHHHHGGSEHDQHLHHHDQEHGGHPIEFHPTDDWQYVPDNAVLPDGLEQMIDHATGKRMARRHPVGLHPNHQDLPMAQPGRERNLIEQRLQEVVSENPSVQDAALDHMELEGHRLNVGESITHAKNFKNLIQLLEVKSESTRLKAATIIAGCLRTNRGAVQGALMSPLVKKAVERLQMEPDANVQRRLIAILTYMAEGDLGGTLHQFDGTLGFTALEHILHHGLDPAAFTRTMVLLATLAREAAHDQVNRGLQLLNAHLPKVQARLDDAYMASFEPICEAEKHQTHSNYPHIRDFCRKYGVSSTI